MGIAEGGVSDLDRRPRPQFGREPLRTEIEKPLPGAVRGRPGQVDPGRPLDLRIQSGRRVAIRLVDRHLGEPAQQLGATVGWHVVVSSSGRSSMKEVETSPARKAGSSRTACRNGMLVLTPRIRNSASARRARATGRLERPAAAGQLDQHRVEVGADLDAGVDGAAVQPHPCAARRPVGGDRASVGTESVRRVLGGDPALQRSAVDPDVLLDSPRSASVSPAAIRICACTRSTSVISSVTVCSTWIRGFISMKTCWPARGPSVSTRNSTVPAHE